MERFLLDDSIDFLNHGSFGAVPRSVLEAQARWRDEIERQPVLLLARRLWGLLDEALAPIAPWLGADPADLVFVPNATAAVAAVLDSLDLGPGDEILTTDHRYGAVGQALSRAARRRGFTVVEAEVPFPPPSDLAVLDAVAARLSHRTRLLLVDQITSPTALIFPVHELVALAREVGALVFVDGAHAPGHVPVDLGALGADWWTGNLHKWAFAPRPCGLLWTRRELQATTRAAIPSHWDEYRAGFHWTGTFDPSAWLAAPAGLEAHARLGGPALMAENRAKARAGREILARALGFEDLCPDAMLGAMASIALPQYRGAGDLSVAMALQEALWSRHRIEVPLMVWGGRTLLRISAQVYNHQAQYERLAAALARLLKA